jgi:hypothetical protein
MPVLRRNCNDRSGSKADIPERSSVVRFASESGHRRTRQACPLSADFVAKVIDGFRSK